MKQVWIEKETFAVRMAAFCGMRIPLADGLTRGEAIRYAARYARKRKNAGYEALSRPQGDGWEIELVPPDDYMMIPDDAGILVVERETERGRECWICGCPARIGEPCCETDDAEA